MFIPGFTFPVQEVFKNDYEEIVREFKDFIPAGGQKYGVFTITMCLLCYYSNVYSGGSSDSSSNSILFILIVIII